MSLYLVYDILADLSISKFSRAIRFSALDNFFSLRSTRRLSWVKGAWLKHSGLLWMTLARTAKMYEPVNE
jgi:hypothetical protein